MKAKDFRLGNIVFSDTLKEPIRVDVSVLSRILGAEINHHVQLYFPIPLTEEWIEKMGFKKERQWKGSHTFRFVNEHLDFGIYGNNKNGFTFEMPLYEGDSWNKKLKYVHDLQNLHLMLTEKEVNCET